MKLRLRFLLAHHKVVSRVLLSTDVAEALSADARHVVTTAKIHSVPNFREPQVECYSQGPVGNPEDVFEKLRTPASAAS